MSWLLRNGEVLAALDTGADRSVPPKGALVLRGPLIPGGSAMDAAWCGEVVDPAGACWLEVRRVRALRAAPVGRPRLGRGVVVLADKGAFERWNLKVGDRLEIREV